jgi:hypothetical protein
MAHSSTYTTNAERIRLIATAEALGETMLRDEVLDGVTTLTFDTLAVVPPAAPTAVDILHQKLRGEDLNLAELCQMLRLELIG